MSQYGPRIAGPPPYAFKNVRALGLFFDVGSKSHMQAFLDRVFAPWKRKARFQVGSESVRVWFLDYPAATWTDPDTGKPSEPFAYKEMSIAMRVDIQMGRATTKTWFMPHIYVDSVYAMASGREHIGFSKALAEIDFQDGAPIEVAAHARARDGSRKPVCLGTRVGGASRTEKVAAKEEDALRKSAFDVKTLLLLSPVPYAESWPELIDFDPTNHDFVGVPPKYRFEFSSEPDHPIVEMGVPPSIVAHTGLRMNFDLELDAPRPLFP